MHPAPYRDPLLGRVQRELGDGFDIFTLHRGTTHPEWERGEPPYRHRVLAAPRGGGSRWELHTSVLPLLRAGRYDGIVVPGHKPLTSVVAAAYAKASGAALVYSADTIAARPAGAVRRGAYRGIGAAADAVWTPGAAGRSFWQTQGVAQDRVFEGMYTLSYAEIAAGIGGREQRRGLRAELGLSGRFVHLFVGHFTPARRVPELVRAFVASPPDDSALVLIGRGPDSAQVQALVDAHPQHLVRVLPGVPFDRVHAYFGLADSYVHPGAEPYSLALQEAALVGLPMIASTAVGAAQDYLVDGANGIRLEQGNAGDLASALTRVRDLEPTPQLVQQARARGLDFAVAEFLRMLEAITPPSGHRG